jgi:hypothetical protein
MSRLDSFIRRMSAQRDCLNMAVDLIADVPGPILELGLGNGRTYDHLRDLFPDREIFVFDRRSAAHPDCTPDDDHLFLGDITETLSAAVVRLVATIAPMVDALMAKGGIVCSDQEYTVARWEAQPLPESVRPGRYFVNKVG